MMGWTAATENPRASDPSRVGVVELARRFVALSRLPHVALDIATPAMAALLWLGHFPPASVVLLGLFTAFAGYTTVYALNDLVDHRVDREKMDADDTSHRRYLDAIGGRHPVAQGLVTRAQGWIWIGAWDALGIIGTFMLRPICMAIFLGGAALEALYCLLYRVTPLRALLSGVIKTLGGLAAVFTVDPHPDPQRLLILISMVFFWEIGGQNVPADWTDIDEDKRMSARTVPVFLGAQWAAIVIMVCLCAAIGMSMAVLAIFPSRHGLASMAAALAAGGGLLVYPSVELLRTQERSRAQAVFNSASYYPLALLAIVAFRTLV